MNTWINQNKQQLFEIEMGSVIQVFDGSVTAREAIPVDKLTELFSKEGEELAREMYPAKQGIPFLCDTSDVDMFRREGFLEAYNLQEVKIEALKKEVEELMKKYNNLKYYFDFHNTELR
jgi:hypothetical protein